MNRPLLLATLSIVAVSLLLPLFAFFPYHYLYLEHLPEVEARKTYFGYSNGVTVEHGCPHICMRANILSDIDYVELYKDSIKFFRIEYDALTNDQDADYIRYVFTNSDASTVVVDDSVDKPSWWGHLKTGQWIPLPGSISLQNRHKFDLQIFLSLTQVQKAERIGIDDTRKSNGTIGIKVEPIPDVSYTNQSKVIGFQQKIPWKITARTDKGVVNVADEIAIQDSHFSIGSWQKD
ncbi:MAG: hypothetical protein RI947_388 [Candidatus Parcubacteria bacterium]|jgi:hypothetical protein